MARKTNMEHTEKTVEQARDSLTRALPYFRHAVEEARKKGIVKLGILSENRDGSGKLEMKFECDEFFEDLALVLGAPAQSEEDTINAKALSFMQQHGLKVAEG